jgi:hypothetical protein
MIGNMFVMEKFFNQGKEMTCPPHNLPVNIFGIGLNKIYICNQIHPTDMTKKISYTVFALIFTAAILSRCSKNTTPPVTRSVANPAINAPVVYPGFNDPYRVMGLTDNDYYPAYGKDPNPC